MSLIGNYRTQFTSLISRSSYSEFIDKLRALVDKRSARFPRDGFALTDRRMGVREIESEVDYCLYCHDRDKDSCNA